MSRNHVLSCGGRGDRRTESLFPAACAGFRNGSGCRFPRCSVAAESTWIWWERPAFCTRSFMTNSAIGLRQMLPWQMNSIFIISFISLHRPSNLDITGFRALFLFLVFCPKPTLFFVNLRRFTGKWCSKRCILPHSTDILDVKIEYYSSLLLLLLKTIFLIPKFFQL